MTTPSDAAEAVLLALQNGATAALVQGGADNILEAGDLYQGLLIDAEQARGTASKVLAVSVLEAGDQVMSLGLRQGTVLVYVFDKHRGNRNLRLARNAICADLHEFESLLADAQGLGRGLLTLTYAARTGYRYSREHAADFEALTFNVVCTTEED